ncbi:hypothetical protein FOZ63_030273 [Perkinsus olseni]|uniref:Uncharacterized protein n=1 Tax=Perkinsus olseni TaxID=32597 RepID=A0A7J6QL10_PEROL|nr:hypothetical protein FOZ60_009479 [Perkinsus olseni]KAF4708973.1 hypothetical protein FOZ63_030273 [Perkinsus olseni]KAF4747077.1 hypothetical protein FOZ62_027964 [Perkinsus olseni]
MSTTLGYLSCILLISVVAATGAHDTWWKPAVPSSLRSLATDDTYSEPSAPTSAEGDVDSLATLLAAQVRTELSTSSTNDYLLQGLATTAADDQHPFWVLLADLVREEFGPQGLSDTELVSALASAVENGDDFSLMLPTTETTASSPSVTHGVDLSRPQAAVSGDTTNPFVRWIASIWLALTGR